MTKFTEAEISVLRDFRAHLAPLTELISMLGPYGEEVCQLGHSENADRFTQAHLSSIVREYVSLKAAIFGVDLFTKNLIGILTEEGAR